MGVKKKNENATRRRDVGGMKKNRNDMINRNQPPRRSRTTANPRNASNSSSKSQEKRTKSQDNNKKISTKRRLKLGQNQGGDMASPQMLKKVKRLEQENAALNDKIKKLEDNFQSVYKTASDLERERDFYFGKALSIENILKNESDTPLKTKLLAILYQGDSGDNNTASPQSVSNVITDDVEMQQTEEKQNSTPNTTNTENIMAQNNLQKKIIIKKMKI